ncbi:uncharacterized protein LOC111629401 [Centruroides sculpturatus]|uniref:uncharacterized protein LOC111629401 n=1 Tax=Centruroides sculpturatus TaxID=218467 RepID=UPI000C6EF517|nr:uncharacterized protein LOC111629401 [Centruroides sculpturatus]
MVINFRIRKVRVRNRFNKVTTLTTSSGRTIVCFGKFYSAITLNFSRYIKVIKTSVKKLKSLLVSKCTSFLNGMILEGTMTLALLILRCNHIIFCFYLLALLLEL